MKREQGVEVRQLMIEAPALLGAIMLLLDRRIPSLARERSVVSHFRARGGTQVCETAHIRIWQHTMNPSSS